MLEDWAELHLLCHLRAASVPLPVPIGPLRFGSSLLEMINSEELIPVISAMQEAMELSMEQTKEVFVTIAIVCD